MARHPIFTEEHERLRMKIRPFLEREFEPYTEEWERTTIPDIDGSKDNWIHRWPLASFPDAAGVQLAEGRR